MTTARKTAPRKAPAKRAMPHKPEGVKEPMDHQKPAAQREAEGVEMLAIEYGDITFEIPADPDDWPTLATQAMSNNRHIDGIQHLLGPMQWAKFISNFPVRRQFNEFAEIIAAELGFGTAGN